MIAFQLIALPLCLLLSPQAGEEQGQEQTKSPYQQRFVPRTAASFSPDATPDGHPFKAVWASAALRIDGVAEGFYWMEVMPADDGTYLVNLRLQRNASGLDEIPVPLGAGQAQKLTGHYDQGTDRVTFATTDSAKFNLSFKTDRVRIRDQVVRSGATTLELDCTPLDQILEWEFHDVEGDKIHFFRSLLCTVEGSLAGKPVSGLVSFDMFWGSVGDGLWGEESVIFKELEEAWIIYYHQTPRGEPAYGTLFLGQGGWAGGYVSTGAGKAKLLEAPSIRSIQHHPQTGTPTSITVDPAGTFTSVTRMDTLGEWGCWIRARREGSVEPQFVWWEHVNKPAGK